MSALLPIAQVGGGLDVANILIWYLVLIISLVVHEAAHAWMAWKLGDNTAYEGGQVTLNPIPHMKREPFGTIVLPLIVLFASNGTMIFGFAHAPIDAHWALRNPRRAALVSFLGPFSNFLLVGLGAGLYHLVGATGWFDLVQEIRIEDFLVYKFILLNIFLGILNLIPLPPLDGAGVVEGLFPKQMRPIYDRIRSVPFLPLILLVVLIYTDVLPRLYLPPFAWVKDVLLGI